MGGPDSRGMRDMTYSGVRERVGQPGRVGGAAYDLIAAKLMRPLVRPGTICRSSLIERLAKDTSHPIVSVVAPAGYGKTTLLSQWAEADGQAFAWVSVDEADNDPKVLLTYVAEALDAIEPIGERVFDALASPASSVPGSVVPRLGSAFASMTSPVTLVLDDVHLLHNSECRAALSVLADHVPSGSRLVLAGRDQPPLRTARLRAEGKLLQIGAGDLSLTVGEAASLLRASGVRVSDEDVAGLHRRTEGWPAGLYLAALYLREGGSLPGTAASFGGDDQFVSEYVESEFLTRVSSSQRAFLTRTAVLERMCGPLCDAVLETGGSAAVLAGLARSNLLLVPLDRRGQWYRYHHLFRDMLLAEAERLESGLIPVLRRRAATWCLRHDLPEEALEYSMAAGDVDTVARLVEELWRPTYRRARITTLQRWFRWLDDRGGFEDHPRAAAYASIIALATGRAADAERMAYAVDRWRSQDVARAGNHLIEALAAALRALLCRHGAGQMHADADEAARQFAAAGIVRPMTGLLQGIAHILSGDLDSADVVLDEAVRTGQEIGTPDTIAQILCERSLVAMARNQWNQAAALAGQARSLLDQAGLEDATVFAAQARVALHRGDVPAARRELASAQRLRSLLTYALPHLAVQTRIELIRAHIALADTSGARTLMREVDDVLKLRPSMGILVGEAEALRAQLSKQRSSIGPGASALTAAELRLLPLLATHMSFPEIAGERFVSPNTIKAQAISIYRKLGVSSRHQAVTRSRELGLLDG